MSYVLTFSSSFEKHFKNFQERQRRQIRNKLQILIENPMHPSLRLKRIRGTAELWEMSVNMDIRIILRFEGNTIILLLDIGHHNILNKY